MPSVKCWGPHVFVWLTYLWQWLKPPTSSAIERWFMTPSILEPHWPYDKHLHCMSEIMFFFVPIGIYWHCICSMFPVVSLREGDSIDVMDCPDIADCHCDVPRQNTHTEKDKEEDVQAAACGWQSLKNWMFCFWCSNVIWGCSLAWSWKSDKNQMYFKNMQKRALFHEDQIRLEGWECLKREVMPCLLMVGLVGCLLDF